MSIQVFDFPKLHHFGSQTGKELVLALSEQDDLTIFDRSYVQALLEYQWPAIRYAIIRNLMIPYLLFLIAFNYYSLYQFEAEYADPHNLAQKVNGWVVKLVLGLLSIYFLMNEYVQLKNETSALKYFMSFWNYIDVTPIIFVMAAIILSLIPDEEDLTIIRWQRYLNAIASFFIWFKFLYFFRVFRLYGHLIKTITEVIVDVEVFLVILILANLAFSGTFYILSQNNTDPDQRIGSYL